MSNWKECTYVLIPRGYNIGIRLIDEFLAKSGQSTRCADFVETANVIAKVAADVSEHGRSA